MMTFRKFLYLSLALHVLLAIAFYKFPLGRETGQKEYYQVRLVEPPAPALSEKPPPPVPPEIPPARVQPVPALKPPPAVRRKPPEVVPEKLEGPEKAGKPEGKPEGELKPEKGAEPETEKAGPVGGGKEGTGPPGVTAEGPGIAPAGPLSNALQPGGAESERLFDKDIIAKLSRKPESSVREGITFDTTEFKYYSYMRRLKERIESIWQYPPSAASRGIYGDLYIRFAIKKNGRLGQMEVIRTSGVRELDEAAVKALKDADPYWPLPTDWKEDELVITGHFVYSLYGTYVR
jgi:protein TonB